MRAVDARASGARLRLTNLTISTPSCAVLSAYQAYACAACPSAAFTVLPGSLTVHSWEGPKVSAQGVTLQCTGTAAPLPCVALAVGTGQELLDALVLSQHQVAAAIPLNVLVTADISFAGVVVPCPPGTANASSSSAAAATCGIPVGGGGHGSDMAPPVVQLMQQQIVIAGGSVRQQPWGGQDVELRPPELDLGGTAALLRVVTSGSRLELRGLSLMNLPLGPPTSSPESMLGLMMWTFNLPSRGRLGGPQGAPLLLNNVTLRLEPEEMATWINSTSRLESPAWASAITDAAPTTAAPAAPGAAAPARPRRLCAIADVDSITAELVPGAGAGGQAGMLVKSFFTRKSGALLEWVLLTDAPSPARAPRPAPPAPPPCAFPLWPGCGSQSASGTAGSTPEPPYPVPIGSTSPAVPPVSPSALPLQPLCRLQPAALPGAEASLPDEATPLTLVLRGTWPFTATGMLVSWRASALPGFYVPVAYPLRHVLTMDSALADNPALSPSVSWNLVQANITCPTVLLGHVSGPRALALSARPALINLRSRHASITLRDMILTAPPPAGLHPAAAALLAAAAAAAPHPRPPPAPPVPPSPPPPYSIVISPPTYSDAIGTDPTGGLAPGLANFTSCLWTFDFDRPAAKGAVAAAVAAAATEQAVPEQQLQLQPAAAAAGSLAAALPYWLQGEAGQRPAGLPWLFLDNVVLRVPRAELLVLAWCAVHGSTDVVADPRVAAEVAEMLAGSELVDPDLVRAQLRTEWKQLATGGGESGTAQPALPSITFWRLRWCSLEGRNVTLAAALPYQLASTAGSEPPLELPVAWAAAAPPTTAPQLAGPPESTPAQPVAPATPQPAGIPASASPAAGSSMLGSQGDRTPGPTSPLDQHRGQDAGEEGEGGEHHEGGEDERGGQDRDGGGAIEVTLAPSAIYPAANSSAGSAGPQRAPLSRAVLAGILAPLCAAAFLGGAAAAAWCVQRRLRARPNVGADAKGSEEGGGKQGLSSSEEGGGDGAGGVSPSAPSSNATGGSGDSIGGVMLVLEAPGSGALCDKVELTQQAAALAPSSASAAVAREGPPHGSVGGHTAAGRVAAAAEQQATWALRGELRAMHSRIHQLQVRTQGDAPPPGHGRPRRPSSDGSPRSSCALLRAELSSDTATPPAARQVAHACPSPPPCAQQPQQPLLALHGELGRGAQGVVYRGTWRGLEVAVKSVLFHDRRLDPGDDPWVCDATGPPGGKQGGPMSAAVLREAAIATGLCHPNVVHCYSYELTPLGQDGEGEAPPLQCSGSSATSRLTGMSGWAAGSSTTTASGPWVEAWRLTLVFELCRPGSLRSFLSAEGEGGDEGGGEDLRLAIEHVAAAAEPVRGGSGASGVTCGAGPNAEETQHPPDAADGASMLRSPFLLPLPLLLPAPPPHAAATALWGPPAPPSRPPAAPPAMLLPVRLAADVARGMAYLHARGVVHGDLTSANVLLCRGGGGAAAAAGPPGAAAAPAPTGQHRWSRPGRRPGRLCAKVCDFGLSAVMAREVGQTHASGPCRRTSAYSAPELVSHGRSGYASDVYAFGVLLWELALGLPLPAALERPVGRPLREWLAAQARAGAEAGALPPQLLAWPEGAPGELAALAAECLNVDPKARPGFQELVTRLEALAAGMEPERRAGRFGEWQPVALW